MIDIDRFIIENNGVTSVKWKNLKYYRSEHKYHSLLSALKFAQLEINPN